MNNQARLRYRLPVMATRHLPLCLVIALAGGCAQTDTRDLQDFIATQKKAALGVKLEPPPEVRPYQPFTYNAQGYKDPFIPASFAQRQVIVEQPDHQHGPPSQPGPRA